MLVAYIISVLFTFPGEVAATPPTIFVTEKIVYCIYSGHDAVTVVCLDCVQIYKLM